jgi:hypothetical protein
LREASGSPTLYGYVLNNPLNWRDPEGLQYQAPGPPPGRPPDGVGGGPNEWVPKGQSGSRPAYGPRDKVAHPKGSQPRATWDPKYSHWDFDDGWGNRTRVTPQGTPAPTHPGQTSPVKPRARPPWRWPGLRIPGSPPSLVPVIIHPCVLDPSICMPSTGRKIFS